MLMKIREVAQPPEIAIVNKKAVNELTESYSMANGMNAKERVKT